MILNKYKEITYKEYLDKTKNMNDIQLAFSGYKKELITPYGISIYDVIKYIDENRGSSNTELFKYYVEDGYETVIVTGERFFNKFKELFKYEI